MTEKKSFTLIHKGLINSLVTTCAISKAYKSVDLIPDDGVKKYNAIWDTGATGCVVSEKVASDLDLKPIAMRNVHTAGGVVTVSEYMINIFLPNNVGVTAIRATEGKLGDIDVLIGMDIIARGDFAITHKNGNTTFTFQMPSTHDIDFVKEFAEEKEIQAHTPIIKDKKVERNDPCPCGSGKKYKNCHGK